MKLGPWKLIFVNDVTVNTDESQCFHAQPQAHYDYGDIAPAQQIIQFINREKSEKNDLS